MKENYQFIMLINLVLISYQFIRRKTYLGQITIRIKINIKRWNLMMSQRSPIKWDRRYAILMKQNWNLKTILKWESMILITIMEIMSVGMIITVIHYSINILGVKPYIELKCQAVVLENRYQLNLLAHKLKVLIFFKIKSPSW